MCSRLDEALLCIADRMDRRSEPLIEKESMSPWLSRIIVILSRGGFLGFRVALLCSGNDVLGLLRLPVPPMNRVLFVECRDFCSDDVVATPLVEMLAPSKWFLSLIMLRSFCAPTSLGTCFRVGDLGLTGERVEIASFSCSLVAMISVSLSFFFRGFGVNRPAYALAGT